MKRSFPQHKGLSGGVLAARLFYFLAERKDSNISFTLSKDFFFYYYYFLFIHKRKSNVCQEIKFWRIAPDISRKGTRRFHLALSAFQKQFQANDAFLFLFATGLPLVTGVNRLFIHVWGSVIERPRALPAG